MKKTFTFLALFAAATLLITACGKKEASTQELTKAVSYEDTIGFSEFQQWKAQNERAEFEEYQKFKNGEMPQQQAVATKTSTPRRSSGSSGNSGAVASTPQPAQKKGWSKAAKGTVIGAGSGAVIGAVVNKKNRGLGAVVRGVIGGGVGYGIGRGEDRKDGRVR